MPAAEEAAKLSNDEAIITALQSGLNTGDCLCKHNLQGEGKGLYFMGRCRSWCVKKWKDKSIIAAIEHHYLRGWEIRSFARTQQIFVSCTSLTSEPFPR